MLDEFGPAIAELTWFHSSADAALDVRGQSTEGGGGGAVFDEEASYRLHGRRLTKKWRYDVDKRERVAATLVRISPEARRIIEKAFVASGEPQPHVDAYFTTAGVRLYRLARETPAAREAFEKKKQEAKRPAWWTISDWFDEYSRSLAKMKSDLQRLRSNKPALGVFEQALNAAVSALAAALAEYEPHRKERVSLELSIERTGMDAELDVLTAAERDIRATAVGLDEEWDIDTIVADLAPESKRCRFETANMVCILEHGHPSEPVLGGHHIVRRDILEEARAKQSADRKAS